MVEGGPYLNSAVLCASAEHVDGKTWTITGVFDQYQVPGGFDSPEQMPPIRLKYVIFVLLRSGSARGTARLGIRPEKPSGLRQQTLEVPMLFRGDEQGMPQRFALESTFDEEGLYWFDVLLDGALLTRIPLRVTYQRVSQSRG